jgi:invasion protein IalB
MKHALKLLLITFCAIPALAGAESSAPQPKILDHFNAWTVYRHFEGRDKPVCYMAAPPVKSDGKYAKRDQPFFMITNRPAENSFNVVSFIAGYDYDVRKPVMLKIDDTDFVLVPNKDMAWAPDQNADNRVSDAIQRGKTMTIIGMSSRGTKTEDTFDLSGSAKAFDAISDACTKKTF